MGRTGTKITLTHVIDGQDVVEKYDTLKQCATQYGIAVGTLYNIIERRSVKRNVFPAGTKFEITENPATDCPRPSRFRTWHCDICKKDIAETSKPTHLVSIKHQQRVAGERD